MTNRPIDRYEELLAVYRDGLDAPGPEVKRAVMAVLADRRRKRTRVTWRWFVQPHLVPVRPLLAAAALILVVGLTAAIVRLTVQDGIVPGAPAGAVLVHFEVNAPEADRVALAGSFNGWSDSTTLFTKSSGTGRWTVTIPLVPGEHEYLFVVDGEEWIPDPEAHAQVDDGFGNVNSMIVVGPRGVVKS